MGAKSLVRKRGTSASAVLLEIVGGNKGESFACPALFIRCCNESRLFRAETVEVRMDLLLNTENLSPSACDNHRTVPSGDGNSTASYTMYSSTTMLYSITLDWYTRLQHGDVYFVVSCVTT